MTSQAEKEARVATARWQQQCLATSALLDAIDNAIEVLDGTVPLVGVDLHDCNRAARTALDKARRSARGKP